MVVMGPAAFRPSFICRSVSRQRKGSNRQFTPTILAPARAIRTAHSPGLVFCHT